MRRTDPVYFLAGVATLAGASGVLRLVERGLGRDALGTALALVLAAAGAAVGAMLGQRLAARGDPAGGAADSARRFARATAIAALAVGATPVVGRALDHGPLAARLVGALLAFGLPLAFGLLVPLAARLSIRTRAEVTSEAAAGVGAWALGAACGILIGPWVAVPILGFTNTAFAAAALLATCAALAWAQAHRHGERSEARGATDDAIGEEAADDGEPRASNAADGERLRTRVTPLFDAAFLTAAAAAGGGVVLTRLVAANAGSAPHVAAILSATAAAGLGFGARHLAERRTRTGLVESERLSRVARARDAAFWAATCAPLVVIAGLLALRLQWGVSDLFAPTPGRAAPGDSDVRALLRVVFWSGLALFLPMVAFGVATCATGAAIVTLGRTRDLARRTALVFATLVAGAALGASFTAFLAWPHLGPVATLSILAVLPCVAAWRVDRARRALVGVAGAAGLAALAFLARPLHTTSGSSNDAHTDAARARLHRDERRTAHVVTTETVRGDTVRTLVVDGEPRDSDGRFDAARARLLGEASRRAHGSARRALVVGLGASGSLGALLESATLEELVVIEESAAVRAAAEAFDGDRRAARRDPRVRIEVEDRARRLAREPGRFDVVVLEALAPRVGGAGEELACERFELVRAALASGGVAALALPLDASSDDDVRAVVAAWCASFGHVSAWSTGLDLVLLGSEHEPPGEDALIVDGGSSPAPFLAGLDADVRALVRGVEPATRERPRLEFPRAPWRPVEPALETLRWIARAPAPAAGLTPSSSVARDRAAMRTELVRFLERRGDARDATAVRRGGPAAEDLAAALADLELARPREAHGEARPAPAK